MAWGEPTNGGADASLVAGMIELMNNPPEVSIPFGNSVVDRLSGSLTYTRAGETGNFNLSGVSETLLADKIAITKDGVSIYGEHTNEIEYSEDFSEPVWAKPAVTVNSGVTDSPEVGVLADELVSNDSVARYVQQAAGFLAGDIVYTTIKIKKSVSDSVTFRVVSSSAPFMAYTFSTDTFSTSGTAVFSRELLANGWVELKIAYTMTADTNVNMRMHCGDNASPVVGDSVYVWGGQLSLIDGPYIKTTTAPATRGADKAYIPMMNSLPAPGSPFTIVIDSADIPTSLTTNAFLWSGDALFYARRQVASGAIQFATGSGTATTASNFDTSSGVKFAFVYDGVNATIYANGLQVAISASGTPVYNLNNNLSIGSYYTFIQPVNTELKGLEIYHYALSENAILALGAA